MGLKPVKMVIPEAFRVKRDLPKFCIPKHKTILKTTWLRPPFLGNLQGFKEAFRPLRESQELFYYQRFSYLESTILVLVPWNSGCLQRTLFSK